MDLDDIDRAILAELEADGRLSNVELADRVGLSPSPCLRRVRRLEEAGVIRGYRAVVAPEVDDRGLVVIAMVRLRVHDRDLVTKFEQHVVRMPGVREVEHLAGDHDYMLRIEVADLAAYDHFTREVITRAPGVGSVTSHVVLSTLLDPDRGIEPAMPARV